ncbi:MAG: hypothetical protein Q9221_008013 [Calogaya cf. arnoldii]
MAPATDTALGINELVSAILAYLPKKDLKSARQVNKRWASLGGQMLIGTLYISPREIDMNAFEGITKHQDLAKSVKHLVYDSAQFYNFDSAASYYAELYEAHVQGAYLHLGQAHSAIEGFNEVVHCGEERNKWSPFNSIVIRSMIPDEVRRLIDSGRIERNGRRLVGSPSARKYIPTGLQPLSAKPMYPPPDAEGLLKTGLSDGQWESVVFVGMLHRTGQKPPQINLTCDIETISGFPTVLFSTGGYLQVDAFLALADNVRVLYLDLDSWCIYYVAGDLRLLVQFLQKAIKLEELTLKLPFTTMKDVETYRLDHIFNPITEWIRPSMTRLDLVDLSAGYEDLSRLLFVNLPNLQHLRLDRILLRDGIWEDIVEGLRQIVQLTTCRIGGNILQSNGTPYLLNETANSDVESLQFLEANHHYILYGGTHPRYPMYVPSQEFNEGIAYWKQLRSEFKEAQDSGWVSRNLDRLTGGELKRWDEFTA